MARNEERNLSQDIEDIFNLETELFPCLVDMRFLGVRVDIEAAQKLKEELVQEEKACLEKVWKETGEEVQIWAANQLKKFFKIRNYLTIKLKNWCTFIYKKFFI